MGWRPTLSIGFIFTCHPDVVGRHLVSSAVHSAVPGPRVPGLQPGDGQGVAGRVQPDPAGVDEGGGAQLCGEHGNSGVLYSRQGGTRPGNMIML